MANISEEIKIKHDLDIVTRNITQDFFYYFFKKAVIMPVDKSATEIDL